MDNIIVEVKNSQNYYYRLIGEYIFENTFIFEKERKYGLLDFNFQIQIPEKFDEIIPAYSDHVWCRNDTEWCLYSIKGKRISTNSYCWVEAFTMQFALSSIDGENFGFINRSLEWVISPRYQSGKYLGLNFFAVRPPNKDYYIIIDRHEKTIFSEPFEVMPTFSEIVITQLKTRKPLKEWLKLQ